MGVGRRVRSRAQCNMSSPLSLAFLFFFSNDFIHLFSAVVDLCCCAPTFSSCGKQGLLSSGGVHASHRAGCFFRGAQAPQYKLQ